MFNRQKFFDFILNSYLNRGRELTQGEIYRILYEMHKHGLLYHLDDDPDEVGNSNSRDDIWNKLFDTREVSILKTVVPAMFADGALPDFDNDPHAICVELTCDFDTSEEGNVRTLPRWGFSFDDQEENNYIGFTEPKRWNGWGCPLLSFRDVNLLLTEGEYKFNTTHNDGDIGETFTVIGNGDYQYETEDQIVIKPENVLTPDGRKFTVYDTSALGLCFNIDDCQEQNAADWEGYL